MTDFHQFNEDSHFKKNKIISLPVAKGRITLTNKTLKITEENTTNTFEFEKTEFDEYLFKYFDIQILK